MPYYQQTTKEVLKTLKTSEKGLTNNEIKKRLKKYGKNEFGKKSQISLFKILWNQFNDPLIWVLLLAIFVSILINHFIDAIVIGIIVVLDATFGFFQEYKAEKAIEHLRKLRQFKSRVVRNGKEHLIDSSLLVPGDILILEEGDRVPADARILESIELKVDEASLTGESNPVTKKITPIKKKSILGDQINMVFAGTSILSGRARVIVTTTGQETELGKIAKEIESIETEITPLQKRLKEISKWLTIIVVAVCIVIFALGALRGFELSEMFLMAISLAVAAIPEGLPAVVTITLALGLRKMLGKNALIRKLKSVETLGSVTVICSDKTGTLTKNEMTVTHIYANSKEYTVTGSGYLLHGDILFKGKKAEKEIQRLLLAGTTCNNATIDIGDPTERALKVLAEKAQIKALERKSETPFSSDTKFMTITAKDGTVYMKGALEVVLKKCSKIEINGKIRKITPKDKENILNQNIEFSKKALRVLAFAYGKKELIFLGITGMIDPPREDVKESIEKCKTAGIRTIMITGDHKITAEAVAKEVGIKGLSMEGLDLDKLSDKQLQKMVNKVVIFARVNSLHKARILKALQSNGEIVAMTGDGVNDAPAIKQADVGIAMNLKGTEISKDVSDLILLDDHFSTIVAAVEEGRTIYTNIKKFVKFLLSANLGEIMIITLPILFGLPLPLLAIQILWVNLVTDSFPALALGLDPANPDVMHEKPRNPKESFFHGLNSFMLISTVLATVSVLGIFLYTLNTVGLEKAQTMAFTTLILFELFLVFACRSDIHSIFKTKVNYYLIAAVGLSLALQLVLLYTPLATYFSLVHLGLMDWLIMIPLGASGLIFFELKKLFVKRKEK
jgi:P-type Ca2+ transporter type 2C